MKAIDVFSGQQILMYSNENARKYYLKVGTYVNPNNYMGSRRMKQIPLISILTSESKATVTNMRKNITDQNCGNGIRPRAVGYATNTKPGPVRNIRCKIKTTIISFLLTMTCELYIWIATSQIVPSDMCAIWSESSMSAWRNFESLASQKVPS